MKGIVLIVIPPVEVIVDDDHRAVIVAQGAPANIVISVIPVNPGWSPVSGGNPIPSQAETPVPTAVMGYTPSPRLIGNPCPSANWIPYPSSVVIGPPGVVVNIGNPNITVWPLIGPTAVIIQLRLILIQFNRQITASHISVLEHVPASVPLCEAIFLTGIEIVRTKCKKSIGHDQSLP